MKILILIAVLSVNILAKNRLNNIKDVERLIVENNVQTLEHFLSLLPLSLRKRYHLLHKTGGLGHATAKYPRVIISNEGSSLTLSFSTDPKASVYGNLELMEYDPVAKNFNFKAIQFSYNTRGLRASKLNPAKCMQCHHNKATRKNFPIWDNSYTWEGFYGSIFDYESLYEKQIQPGWSIDYPHGEGIAYKKFIKPKLGKVGLFKYLPADIYSKQTLYMFRTPAQSPVSTNYSILNSRMNVDSYLKQLRSKKKSVKPYVYSLIHTELCLKDKDFSDNGFPAEPTVKDLYNNGLRVFSKKTFSRLVYKLSKKLKINAKSDLEAIAKIKAFFKKTMYRSTINKDHKVCHDQNKLLARLGSDEQINCKRMFDKSVGPIDFIDLFNQFYKFEFRYNLEGHFLLALVFNDTGFGYDYWSTTRTKWKSWTTHNQGRRNIALPLIQTEFVKRDFPELWSFVKKRYRKNITSKYSLRYLEISNYPAHFKDFGEIEATNLCKQLERKSKKYSSKLVNY